MPMTDYGSRSSACSAPPGKDVDTGGIDPPKKNTECEAAHTRYGRMRGILNAMPHAVWRGIGVCQEAHHAMKHPRTGRTVRLSRKRPVAVSECSATFMWGMSDQARFYG